MGFFLGGALVSSAPTAQKCTIYFVGAAETAAPPEIASVPSVEVSSQQEISVGSVGGNFKNVAAWVRQDAIPSYTMGSEMPCIF